MSAEIYQSTWKPFLDVRIIMGMRLGPNQEIKDGEYVTDPPWSADDVWRFYELAIKEGRLIIAEQK